MSYNKALLIGNVGKDPEVRHLDSGASVASFPLATTERFRGRDGNMQEQTEWHNIVCWRGLADLSEKYIHKGSQIFVEGKIRTRSWTDQSGQKRYTTEIIADAIRLLGKKQDGGDAGYGNSYGSSSYNNNNRAASAGDGVAAGGKEDLPADESGSDDDLPF
ncbi:MAG: single-stranded DNA-binding protein [Bacteroidales bacterium]|jgi:single-strand DNA-binding protein|nr:single-stranded DNA-binding protein [Bacteroidales bacterium]